MFESVSAEDGALILYARIWAVHQLLQLHQQRFLFPQYYDFCSEVLVILLLCKPNKIIFVAAIVVRNAARAIRCPFLWDSEFWLALTDISVLTSLILFPTLPLQHAAPWVRRQLAVCYGAAAFFKLNTSFLDHRTSCAPIFALSLFGSMNTIPIALGQTHFVNVLARVAPISVVTIEGLISVLLWSHYKFGEWLALVFHLMIALTPSPNGVPTFSCVAASRLILIIGNDGGTSAFRVLERFRKYHGGFVVFTVATAVAVLPGNRAKGVDPAIILYLILAGISVMALCSYCCVVPKTTVDPKSNRSQWTGFVLVAITSIYAFLPPILGLQEIGSNTMFANMRLHGGSNHLLGVPTGLLQSYFFNNQSIEPKSWLEDWFSGGIVRIEYTNSDYLNRLYPGEITSILGLELRAQLEDFGHVGRQFNPKARRVLGTNIRMGMPYWYDNDSAPFVKYTVPGLEFRRLLADARAYAIQHREAFDLHYTRLDGVTGDENWRKRSPGNLVHVIGDDGGNGMMCKYLNEANTTGTWERCPQSEMVHQRLPPQWALKFMLFYPYAIVPDRAVSEQLSPDELLCNY